jgi:hypothetical protein
MKKLILFILVLGSVPTLAVEENCDGLVPLGRVFEICGKEFFEYKSSTRESRCKVFYLDKSMGKKYGEAGISSELILKVNHRISKEGKNTAAVSFGSSLDGAKKRETYIKDISGIGEGAYYSEQDIHQTVTWYKGEYLYFFTVDKGQRTGEDWVAPCTPDQTIELAKAISSK